MADGASETADQRRAPTQAQGTLRERRATAAMEKHLPRPEWSVRQKLALTARMLAAEEHASGLAGQITARGEGPGTMWTARFGLGFEEVRARDFLLVDADLKVVRGDGMANPSNRFHLWIYRARPDVHCIVHTHPPYCSALSMLGVPLRAAHMDTAMFHEDCAWLETWPGPPIGDEEGELISEALGEKELHPPGPPWSARRGADGGGGGHPGSHDRARGTAATDGDGGGYHQGAAAGRRSPGPRLPAQAGAAERHVPLLRAAGARGGAGVPGRGNVRRTDAACACSRSADSGMS